MYFPLRSAGAVGKRAGRGVFQLGVGRKEELFFDRGAEVAESPAQTVRTRRPGESPLDALERVTLALLTGNDDRLFRPSVRSFAKTVENSAALRARARLHFEQSEDLLATALHEEQAAQAAQAAQQASQAAAAKVQAQAQAPRVVAALLAGLQWLLLRELSTRLLAGDKPLAIRKALLALATVGFAELRQGIGGYLVRPNPGQIRAKAGPKPGQGRAKA